MSGGSTGSPNRTSTSRLRAPGHFARALLCAAIVGGCSDDSKAVPGQGGELGGAGASDGDAAGYGGDDPQGGAAGDGGTAGTAGFGGSSGSSGSSGSGSGGSGGSGPTAESACEDYARILCAKFEQCVELVYLQYPSAEDCVASASANCRAELAASPRWTPANQEACGQATRAGGCEVVHDLPAACARPSGDTRLGGPCFADSECVTGATCLSQSGSACGVCTREAKDGESCGQGAPCQEGLRCDGVCYVPSQEGEHCYRGAMCDSPLVCGQSGGECHAPRRVGESCGPAIDDCDQYDGVACSPVRNVCEFVPTTDQSGAKCGYNSTNGVRTRCVRGLRCTGDDFRIDICRPLQIEGGKCTYDKDGSDNCSFGLYCDGTCKRADALDCR